ncbi:unnamed protein product [Haemonchus placei]|uniref:AA_permease domain-containing protein n=1 Tax=Haemonchus placei TaxID=6290 RepID=A0A0N4WM17_HAEPC|nr:unnamed protein product [Haemonchus placei]
MESLMAPKPFAGNDSAAILDGYGNASLSSSIRVFYPIVLFMSMLSSGESFGMLQLCSSLPSFQCNFLIYLLIAYKMQRIDRNYDRIFDTTEEGSCHC